MTWDIEAGRSIELPWAVPGRLGRWRQRSARAARWARRRWLGAFGAIVILVLIVVGAAPQVFAPRHYSEDFDISRRLEGPSAEFYFGTDQLGRDVFSRVLYGARTSVVIGFGAVAVSMGVSTLLGVCSGYLRGKTDMVLQRFVDIWMAFPGLIFIVFVVSIFGNSTWTIIATLGLIYGIGSSRVVRSATLSVAARAYVEAAQSVGAGNVRIMVRHVLPNVVPVVLVTASVQLGAVILAESSLSFLGFGTPPPFPSWGRMLQEAQGVMQQHPHLALFPGAAIAITVFSFNMLGDALRDTWDPRLRGQ